MLFIAWNPGSVQPCLVPPAWALTVKEPGVKSVRSPPGQRLTAGCIRIRPFYVDNVLSIQGSPVMKAHS
ncbi:hypothetical protein [Rhodopirellula sallentina]|uniref:hypothetical protein n=1 Tax=Rhodopirellula sallentina TaxID=1263869 RepID=UPI00118181E9|nr:hypothetical protein [Rhodopirellula sallentina]